MTIRIKGSDEMRRTIHFTEELENEIKKAIDAKPKMDFSKVVKENLEENFKRKKTENEYENTIRYQEHIKENYELIQYIIDKSVKKNFKELEDIFAETIVKINKKFFEEYFILSIVLRNVLLKRLSEEQYKECVDNSKRIAVSKIKNNPFLLELLQNIGGDKDGK
jgi:hypothetical protein